MNGEVPTLFPRWGRMSSFVAYPLTHGLVADLRDDPFPTRVSGWNGEELSLDALGTHFGFVQCGPAVLRCASGVFPLTAGMYFAVPGSLTVGPGQGVVVTRQDASGFFHLGGPIEGRGRLRYIDGCTDSLLIPPVIRGDACLNLLHLPPGTRQQMHRHPSVRVGLVIRGEGVCVTPEQQIPLSPGMIFQIRAGGLHCFTTRDSELLVLAYHPDSDVGPTHEDHPMINRTLIPDRVPQEGR